MNELISEVLEALSEQVKHMQQLADQEALLQRCVMERDWTVLEELIPRMATASEAIEAAENARDYSVQRLALALGLGPSPRFSDVVAALPEESRMALADLYRRLKIVVLRLQSRTASIDTYVRSSVSTMRAVMRELYPEHAAPVYSRSGGGIFTGGQALVVNHHL